MNSRFVVSLAVPLLLLSACEEETAPDADTAETGGEAAGEVLGGTISDDMIALEELTSTSPPAERTTPERGSSGEAPVETGEPEAETPEAETPEEAPASDPDNTPESEE